mgnify:CR=1 FL=1
MHYIAILVQKKSVYFNDQNAYCKHAIMYKYYSYIMIHIAKDLFVSISKLILQQI